MGLFRASTRADEFSAFAAASGPQLRRAAYLLCGNWHQAEDLTQAALTKIYLRWNTILRTEALDAYARKVLLRCFLDERRLGRSTEVVGLGNLDVPVSAPGPELRMTMEQALASLAPRQRAVVVLRYWEDMDIATVAETLDCTPGTVKSTAARALEALRRILADQDLPLTLRCEGDLA